MIYTKDMEQGKDTEYHSWNDKIEVTGETILAMLAAMKSVGGDYRAIEYLSRNNIQNPEAGKWYSLKDYLASLRMIYEHLGDHTLFSIGKEIPNNSIFPPQIKTFNDAMSLLNAAYQANHRGGYIGHFKFEKINSKSAYMECKRTYGTMIDKGVLIGLSRKFRPEQSLGLSVELDESKPNRQKGADSHTFILKW